MLYNDFSSSSLSLLIVAYIKEEVCMQGIIISSILFFVLLGVLASVLFCLLVRYVMRKIRDEVVINLFISHAIDVYMIRLHRDLMDKGLNVDVLYQEFEDIIRNCGDDQNCITTVRKKIHILSERYKMYADISKYSTQLICFLGTIDEFYFLPIKAFYFSDIRKEIDDNIKQVEKEYHKFFFATMLTKN
ncbi:MAG: hypothetical protein CR972_03380 [Candidatus Moraniibacteriota bacterium]|nr:MAG: hypothetical protein CR972_03380 [Candidatus Moranbacteria bacterium]